MDEKYIFFNSRDMFFRIKISQIIYFAADKNYTFLQLNNGQKPIFSFSLLKMEEYLTEKLGKDAKQFVRIGKSYIININYIYRIDIVKQKLFLFDNSVQKEYVLNVSKEALKKIRNLFINNNI